MKAFAAAALAVIASAATDAEMKEACDLWKTTNDAKFTCDATKCTAKDEANKSGEDAAHTSWKAAYCDKVEAAGETADGAAANVAAFGALAAAAAALAF